MFIHEYPYTDFHEMNIDWLLCQIHKLKAEMENFKVTNNLEYAGEWDISKAYEKYSIVYDPYTNLGYIAIQPVPNGINITNTDYWAEVANFTAQIADIGNRVTALENEVVDNIKIKKRLTPETNVILIGNSYAYGTGGNGHGWAYWLKQHTGCNEIAHAYQNGGDFIAVGNSNATYPNKNYLQACQEISNSLSEDERKSVDFIIFGGGFNDNTDFLNTLPSSASIRNAIYTVIDYLKPLYPNAEIVLIPLTPPTYYSLNVNTNGYTYMHVQKYVSAWVRGASGRGCMTTAHSKEWFSKRYTAYASDNIHYNEAGYNLCAYYMEAVINGWDGSMRYDLNSSLAFTPAVTSHVSAGGASTIFVWNEGGITHIEGFVGYDAGGDLTVSNQPELFTFDPVFAPEGVAIYFPVFCYTPSERTLGLIRITKDGEVGLRYLSSTTTPSEGEVYIDCSFEP